MLSLLVFTINSSHIGIILWRDNNIIWLSEEEHQYFSQAEYPASSQIL